MLAWQSGKPRPKIGDFGPVRGDRPHFAGDPLDRLERLTGGQGAFGSVDDGGEAFPGFGADQAEGVADPGQRAPGIVEASTMAAPAAEQPQRVGERVEGVACLLQCCVEVGTGSVRLDGGRQAIQGSLEPGLPVPEFGVDAAPFVQDLVYVREGCLDGGPCLASLGGVRVLRCRGQGVRDVVGDFVALAGIAGADDNGVGGGGAQALDDHVDGTVVLGSQQHGLAPGDGCRHDVHQDLRLAGSRGAGDDRKVVHHRGMDRLVLAERRKRDGGMGRGQRDFGRRCLSEQDGRRSLGEQFRVVGEFLEIVDQAADAAYAAGCGHDDAGVVDAPAARRGTERRGIEIRQAVDAFFLKGLENGLRTGGRGGGLLDFHTCLDGSDQLVARFPAEGKKVEGERIEFGSGAQLLDPPIAVGRCEFRVGDEEGRRNGRAPAGIGVGADHEGPARQEGFGDRVLACLEPGVVGRVLGEAQRAVQRACGIVQHDVTLAARYESK